jgi:succinoglycan biosynthesis transport protein ExoP
VITNAPTPGDVRSERPLPSLAEQILLLRRGWRLIFGLAGLALAAASLALSFQQVRYQATGILLYDPADVTTPGDPLTPVQDQQNQDAVTASQSAVIASLPAAREIAAALRLAAVPAFNPALRRNFVPWLWHQAGPENQDEVAQRVRAALDVEVLPNSRILTVSFTAPDAGQAAAGANLAMQLYLNQERENSFAALTAAQLLLETNSAKLQAGLDVTEAQLAQARAAAGVVAGAQASLTTETASRVAASLVEAQADLAMDQARLNAAGAGDAAAANAAIAPNLLPLRKEQADLTAQVRSMSRQYGADYPDLAAARVSLAAINQEIDAEAAREQDAARAQVAADRAEIATLQTALHAARVESESEDAESAPERALEQRADAGRAMLRSMTLQADQLAQDAALTRPDARIISAAAPPAAPVALHRGVTLAAVALLSLCAAILIAGLRDALDTSIRDGEALRGASGFTCLALVPEVRDPQSAALTAPFSLFAEQLRVLHTSLRLDLPDGPALLAITAARPGEGKTTLTIALGRMLTQSGLKVLAIDGDIRQPSFDPAFGLAGAIGLTDHLAGLAGLEQIVHADPASPLAVIAAGTQAQNALKLFLSPALPEFLAQVKTRYDVVLMDVPPAFALAEGRVLARHADGALLCVRWGHTPRRVVAAAVALLAEAGVRISGAALTRVDPVAHGRSGSADAEIYQPRYGGYFT